MRYEFLRLFSLVALPVLIAQWIGVLGIAKAGKDRAWWCMMVGVAMISLGILGNLALLVMMMSGFDPRTGNAEMVFSLVKSGVRGLGSLVFFIGFALHGSRVARLMDRVRDLESIAAAQGEELGRRTGNE